MKRLSTILVLFALALAVRAQPYYAIGFDSNGVIQATGWIRGTNFFQTNMPRFMAAWTNDANVKAWISNNLAYLNRTNRFSGTNFFTTIQANYLQASGGSVSSLTASNFSAPSVGASSQGVGGSAEADYAITFGTSSFVDAAATNGMAFGAGSSVFGVDGATFGKDSVSAFDRSFAFGAGITTTDTNQFLFGDSTYTVKIPGALDVEAIHGTTLYDSTIRGTNLVNARLDFYPTNITTLANGLNDDIDLGANTIVRMTGGSTIVALAGLKPQIEGSFHILKISGAVTNVIVNEANSTDWTTSPIDAQRFKTGTGRNIYQTNQPASVITYYDQTAARWIIVWASN